VVEELEQRLVLSPSTVSEVGVTSPVGASDRFQVAVLPGGDANRVSTDLLVGYDRAKGVSLSPSLQAMDNSSVLPLMTDSQGRVEVNITSANPTTLAQILTSAGMNVVSVLPQDHQVEGYIPWSALPAISNMGSLGLMGIIGVPKPMTNVGLVTSEGVNVMEADRVQASTPGYDGTGVKVGVLSDSYNNRGGAATDIATGDLPAAGVQVIQDLASGGTDEGRAMLQIVHDVAPGSPLAFATAFNTEGNFAANIQNLANAGAKVITDDISYFDEPFFQPSIVAQAVNNVVTNNGVSYFSSAGNIDTQAYDTASSKSYGSNPLNFVTDTIPGIYSTPASYFNFAPTGTANDRMTFSLAPKQGITLGMQWDQPFYTTSGVTTDLDIYLLNHNTGAVVAASTADNIANQTPLEIVSYQNGSSTTQYDLVINKFAGPTPGEIKFVNYGANKFGDVNFGTYATNSATVGSHPGVANAMAVGAVPFFRQRTPESFSSFGPVTFLFDASGNRLASPLTVAKPDIMAPDGVSTTFFGGSNINGFPNFFGTSAAAPHAAGVAALILQAHPSDTPAQVYNVMKSTADPIIGSGDVNQVGSGLIDAYRAIFGGPVPVYADAADGFESGALGSQWQVYTSGAGRVQVSSANGPSSGTYHLVMDANANGYVLAQLDEAILNVNLAGRTNVTLAFDQKFFNSLGVPVVSMPATFTGHNNSNGVAFSVDGTNWYRITSLGSTSSTPYVTDSFNLSQIAAADGVTLGANTLIKFQEYNADSLFAPGLGLALDNVKVGALSVLTQNKIDIGTAQRSAVRSITLTFQGDVTTIPSSAFSLVRNEDGQTFSVNVGIPVFSGGVTTVVLTFGGPLLNGTSLPDGRYTLTINGSQILDNFGNAVDAANNGTAGSTGTLNFFRFFGDFNGDGRVDATDYLAFRAAYLSGVVTPFNSFFDYNGDGLFTVIDFNAFMINFTKRVLT
jgi:subtilisin family serine protease